MFVVCAPDSFKGSMTGPQAAAAMAAGVRDAVPGAEVAELPVSDGGEGFTEAVAAATGARLVGRTVHDQLGRAHRARLALQPGPQGPVAVLDVAAASGLELVGPDERDVMHHSSQGLGELITAALDEGAHRIVVGIGGSSTNEGGAGMLAELGVRFLASDDTEVAPTPAGLREMARVDASGLDQRLASTLVEVACDVTNPLLGPLGASAVYGPQKGATEEQVRELDSLLARLVSASGPRAADLADLPGSGAAGGLGWALQHFLGATLRPGLELVAELVRLDEKLARADLVLTGEGSVDEQTAHGKAVARICEHAARVGVPVLVLGGRTGLAPSRLAGEVIEVVAITPPGQQLPDALRNGRRNLRVATADAVRRWVQADSKR